MPLVPLEPVCCGGDNLMLLHEFRISYEFLRQQQLDVLGLLPEGRDSADTLAGCLTR